MRGAGMPEMACGRLRLIEAAEGFGQPQGGQDVVDLMGDHLGALQVPQALSGRAEAELHRAQLGFELGQRALLER